MLYSHDWLRACVPHDLSADAVADLIGRHVATIDDVRPLRTDLAPIVVARVLTAARHPNSDHLWVTTVDDGTGPALDVVCGAPNVVAGTLYPFARVGVVMPTGNKGGILIERRKIRGEWSNGMLCSARELGLGDDEDGIMPLDIDVATGTPLLSALSQASDTVLEVDVLPNRPDLLSHRGMARELMALTGRPARTPLEMVCAEAGVTPSVADLPVVAHDDEAESAGVKVRVEDRAGCPRYMAVVIRGLTVGPSPEWLVRRLESIGARPISNVVDATNYVLHALGQPMHAFDLARLAGQEIVVRQAKAGDVLITLDGVERKLAPGMTLICDAERPVAVAGVMGGRDSEVTEATRDVLLEVAYFEPRGVRRTRRALGLSTDASHRFERGVDPWATHDALEAAAQLITAIAGGEVSGAVLDVGGGVASPGTVDLDVPRAATLLGAVLAADEVKERLTSVGFQVEQVGDDLMRVTPPSWRADVSRDADLVEELARLRGYDTLSDELTPFRPGTVPDHPQVAVTRELQRVLVGEGFLEVRPMPFVLADDATHVRVANPLSEDEPHLRRRLLETLSRRAEYNLARMEGNVRLFEVGAAFVPSGKRLPVETVHVAALLMGLRRPVHFTEPNPPAYDAWDARELGGRLAEIVHGPGVAVVPGEGEAVWSLTLEGREVGRVERLTLDRPAWAHEAWGIEVVIGVMPSDDVAPANQHADVSASQQTRARGHVQARTLPAFPAVEFDLALLVPDDVSAARVEEVLRASAGPLLEKLSIFDEFRGSGIPAGYRSVAWRLTLRDASRTLRDKEIEGRRAKVLQALEKELGVRLRG